MTRYIDSHCHIHDSDFWLSADEVLENAHMAGVDRMITVGTDVENSRLAVEFAEKHDGVYTTIGIHPGETPKGTVGELEDLILRCHSEPQHQLRKCWASLDSESSNKKNQLNDGPNDWTLKQYCDCAQHDMVQGDIALVGFGDIGLDYHYPGYDREGQIELLKQQLALAVKYDLPVSFHIREAFDDFWPIFDAFPGLRGALHSYTDNLSNLEKGLSRGLYVSINGIATFNKVPELTEVYKNIPLSKLLVETDAPYLTPAPFRAKMNEPARVSGIVQFWANLCGREITEVAKQTTENATRLFSLH